MISKNVKNLGNDDIKALFNAGNDDLINQRKDKLEFDRIVIRRMEWRSCFYLKIIKGCDLWKI